MARRTAKQAKRRGLVLGGGGVLGATWMIGALTALEEITGWDAREAEVVVGTSAGSVVASFLSNGVGTATLLAHQRGVATPDGPVIEYDVDANGPLPQRPRLRIGSSRLLLRTARHPFRVTPLGAVASLLPEGTGSLDAVRRLVESVCPAGRWAEHPRTWIAAMDYDNGRRVVFGQPGAPEVGLSDAVVASCAIPGWYAPVRIDGRRYVDGGTYSTTSLDLLADAGLDEVFVLSPMTSFSYDAPRSRVARLERGFRKLTTRRMVKDAELVRSSGASVVLLGPGAEDLAAIGANLMDPRRRHDVLETSLRTSDAELRRQLSGFAAAG